MEKTKCPRCGLINLGRDETCRRCGRDLLGAEVETPVERKRTIVKRIIWIVGATSILLFSFYLSLLITSDDLKFAEREVVARAVKILEQKGFSREAFVIARLATYRSTDNWWNNYIGHRDAYAATNFPFEVLTLYPEFFEASVDDDERAAMLLHEGYHLLGAGEAVALERVWRQKHRLGWTEAKYGQSKIWRQTKELTMAEVPTLFQCGSDGKTDCTQ
jgi:hypothetical protein